METHLPVPQRLQYGAQDEPLSHPRPEWTDIKTMQFWNALFPEALERFRSTVTEPKDRAKTEYNIRILDNWDAVYEKLEKARAKYQSEGGRVGLLRKVRRKAADRVLPVAEITKSVSKVAPNDPYATPVLGAVQILLDAVQVAADVRNQVLTGFDGLIPAFSDVELFLGTFPRDVSVRNASLELTVATLVAVERAIGFFIRNEGNLEGFESLGKQVLIGMEEMNQLLTGHLIERDLQIAFEREMYRRDMEASRQEVAYLHIENARLHNRACTPQENIVPSHQGWDRNELRQYIGAQDIDMDDCAFAVDQTNEFPARERTLVEQIIHTKHFQDWIRSPLSAKLLVHWDGHLPKTLADMSPLTLFCVSMTQILRANHRFVTGLWICGRHADPYENYAGGYCMVASLVDQLLRDHDFDMFSLVESGDIDFDRIQPGQPGALEELLKILELLVQQLPETITLFCLIDGVILFEREEADALPVLACLLRLAGEPNLRAAVKILFTSCVLASRISKALPTVSLLVIERGVAQDDRVTPALGFTPGFGSEIETNLLSTPQPSFEGLAVSQTSGLVLGGSSAVNYETWTRGASVDFDQWAEVAGDRRWSWEGMLPYFKVNEAFIRSTTQRSFQEDNLELHGSDGPITVSHPSNSGKPRDYPLRQDMARFHEALDAKLIPENNAGNIIGYTEAAQSNYDGQRQFAAKGYPFGPNATVWTESEVHHIDMVKKRAPGVTGIRHSGDGLDRKAEEFRAAASVEVILSAGALFSPKLLMLSGIGPKEELDEHAIPVKVDLPVGKNLSDHPCVSTKWIVNKENASIGVGPMVTESCDWAAGPPMDWIAFHRAKSSTLEAVSDHLTTDEKKYYLSEGKAHWECFTMYGPFDTSERPIKVDPPAGESIVSVFNILVSPLSRGSVKLKSREPSDPPVVNPALLTSPADKEILYDAVRSTTTAMKNLEGLDAVEYTIDEALRDDLSDGAVAARVRQGGSTVFHYSGTCAMGTVVDAECRVKGVEGLRVVDASVFPMPLGAHYQAAAYALAEQVVEMIVGNVRDG
ncbi:hypothetical protein CEP54_009122 [Fusarium duplospermum]|uniref:Glucose-methanol-choline oxidoreductase N-terminal domain-containing protein n=1 Tax=Fusarium duplospermum TaxID=1325734 RepID=A0A428PSF4_9HYPO|nr:hypothetical protein CEP54_009122 [Fusarium duplospermum]